MYRPMNRLTITLSLALLTLFSSCAAIDRVGKTKGEGIKWKQGKAGKNLYLAAQVKRPEPTNGFMIFQRELHPPFRWEVTLGLYGKKIPDAGSFGTELDAVNSSPLQFYGISAQPISGGLNVFAASHLSAPGVHGSRFYAGATEVDVAIEHDGAMLRYHSRPRGSGAYDLLAEIDVSGQMMPVNPAVGVAGMAKPAVAGFDRFRIAATALPPEHDNPWTKAVYAAYAAADLQTDAMHMADGDSPDVAGAKAKADEALLAMDDAIVKVEEIPAATKKPVLGLDAAARYLAKARKKLVSAQKKLAKGRAGKSVVKALQKGIVGCYDAVIAIDD